MNTLVTPAENSPRKPESFTQGNDPTESNGCFKPHRDERNTDGD